jgi:hypothetical protein
VTLQIPSASPYKRRSTYHSNIKAVAVSLRSQIPTTTVETTATIRAAGRDPRGGYLRAKRHFCWNSLMSSAVCK